MGFFKMGARPKFKFLDSVTIKNQPNKPVGLVIRSSKSDFGDLFWIQWPKNKDSVMHVSQLVKEIKLKPRK